MSYKIKILSKNTYSNYRITRTTIVHTTPLYLNYNTPPINTHTHTHTHSAFPATRFSPDWVSHWYRKKNIHAAQYKSFHSAATFRESRRAGAFHVLVRYRRRRRLRLKGLHNIPIDKQCEKIELRATAARSL